MSKQQLSTNHTAKQAAGVAASHLIKNGMIIGLGGGSTVAHFIEALALRCQSGLQISTVTASESLAHKALALGIPAALNDNLDKVDMAIDGADEIDIHKNMVKGGGGALLREKILAYASLELVIIVDESKLVQQLGRFPIPVEITPFLFHSTMRHLVNNGYRGKIRKTIQDILYITDNGNYIVDIQYTNPIHDPIDEHQRLKSIVGVVETGLFFNIAGRVIVGYADGSAQTIAK